MQLYYLRYSIEPLSDTGKLPPRLNTLSLILRLSKPQHWVENRRQQDKAYPVSGALPELLGDIDRYYDRRDYADYRNKSQDNPPDRPSGDLHHQDNVVDWDERAPTRLTCLGKNFPDSREYNQQENQRNYRMESSMTTLRPVVVAEPDVSLVLVLQRLF